MPLPKANPVFSGVRIALALGLDPANVHSLQLTIRNGVAEVVAEVLPTDEQADSLMEVLKRYRLVEVEDA